MPPRSILWVMLVANLCGVAVAILVAVVLSLDQPGGLLALYPGRSRLEEWFRQVSSASASSWPSLCCLPEACADDWSRRTHCQLLPDNGADPMPPPPGCRGVHAQAEPEEPAGPLL